MKVIWILYFIYAGAVVKAVECVEWQTSVFAHLGVAGFIPRAFLGGGEDELNAWFMKK